MPTVVILLIVLVAIFLVARTLFGPKAPVSAGAPRGGAQSSASTPPPLSVQDALADLASCVRPKETGNMSAVIQVRVTDHAPTDWHLDLADGRCSLAQGRAEEAPLTVTASTQTWIELAAKRMSFATAYMKGNVQAEGDTGILMRLDDEFSGPIDRSRRPTVSRAASAGAEETVIIGDQTTARETNVAGSHQGHLPNQAMLDALRAVRDDPNLTPEERRAAIMNALQQKLGPNANVRVGGDGSITTSVSSSAHGAISPDEVRAAIRQALANLPPGASRAQKIEAIRTALQNVPNAGNYAALLGLFSAGHAATGHHEGIGGELTGALLEGFLENLFGGG